MVEESSSCIEDAMHLTAYSAELDRIVEHAFKKKSTSYFWQIKLNLRKKLNL